MISTRFRSGRNQRGDSCGPRLCKVAAPTALWCTRAGRRPVRLLTGPRYRSETHGSFGHLDAIGACGGAAQRPGGILGAEPDGAGAAARPGAFRASCRPSGCPH
eukprot:2641636-Prymnesium_polylepis.1